MALMLLAPSAAIAQTSSPSNDMTLGEQWKYAFSAEGRKNWRPEITARVSQGFFYDNKAFTAGIRIDDKRTFGLMLGLDQTHEDAIPAADSYSYFAGLYMRRYFHTGKRQRFSFYSDIAIGGGRVYKATPGADEQKGDIVPFCTLQPGVRIRFWKNTQLFLGPYVGLTDFGLHVGIGF